MQILHKLENAQIKNKIRLHEKRKDRIILANCDVLFNLICLDEGLSIFTNIYIYIDVSVYITSKKLSQLNHGINIGSRSVRIQWKLC